jgi:hypothetical protein
MLRRLFYLVRKDERRQATAAFAFLALFVGSHTALETSRDALFLEKVSSEELPMVYVVIAVLAFAVARLQASVDFGPPRRELAVWCVIGGAGSLVLGAILPAMGKVGLYALYVWPGVISTLALVHFWTLLAGLFTATQAKRLFGIVSLGAMIGAILGSAGVTVAVQVISPRALVACAGGGFLLSAWLPLAFLRGEVSDSVSREARLREGTFSQYVTAMRGPYARRLVGLALVSAAALTLADYVFKSSVAATFDNDRVRLAEAFGTIYTGLNVLSLVVQVVGVGMVLRRLAPPIVLAVLPTLLAASGVGLALTGALGAALAVKGADGALRYSLHKTAFELLIVPLAESARRTVKATMEVVGQRGGQIVASVTILLATALGVHFTTLSWLLAAAAVIWAVGALRLRAQYIEQFRTPVAMRGAMRLVHVPKLDVASLETLIAALDSASTDEVMAALGILEREQKAALVPTLILYHPDEEVVIAALRLFSRTRRRAALHAIDGRLLGHPSRRLRAEAYAARAAIEADTEMLRHRLESEESTEARAAIAAILATSDDVSEAEARATLEQSVAEADAATLVVVCEILGWRNATRFDDVLVRLANASDFDVRRSAIHSLGDLATPRALGALLDLLGEEPLQRSVFAALSRTGPAGFAAMTAALRDQERPAAVRWALPRALALCDAERAAPVLLQNLGGEPDGMVRFCSIVTLGKILEQSPRIRLDRRLLDHEIRINVARAYRYLDRRLVLEAGAREVPARKTPGLVLLCDLLRDKQRSAIGRIFRLLALAFPQHRFVDIYLAIESGERDYRATAVELTHNLLRSPLRDAVVGLVDELDDEARLTYAAGYHQTIARDYDALVGALLGSASAIVRDIAAFHAAELGLAKLVDRLRQLVLDQRGTLDIERALRVLEHAASRDPVPPTSLEPVRVG